MRVLSYGLDPIDHCISYKILCNADVSSLNKPRTFVTRFCLPFVMF